MNKILIILLSAFVLLSFNKEQKAKDYILFSGKVLDAKSKEFKLLKRERERGNFKQITIKLEEDGSFIADTIISGTGRYAFHDGRNIAELYLTAGGEYQFSAVEKQFGTTAKLTGTDPDASNYLMTKIARIIRLRGGYAEFNALDEKEFVLKQKKLNESYVSYLDSFPNIQKEFVETERKELYYRNLLNLSNYEKLHRRYAKKPDFKVSGDFLKQLDKVDFTNEAEYKRRGSYKKLVNNHFNSKVDALLEEEKNTDKYLAKLKVLGEIPNEEFKNLLLLAAATSEIKRANDIDEYFETFKTVSTSEENNKKLTEKYESLKKLTKGSKSPVFTDYVNHAGGTTSLSDLKGKYVYIDVWATWCGPCLKEVPALKKVEKQYHGKNIEFVSISVDVEKAHGKWRKMVTDKELSGLQLLADKAFQSEFVSAYQISGIPRFILIDPKGEIVTANAPRPSSTNLISLFDELGI